MSLKFTMLSASLLASFLPGAAQAKSVQPAPFTFSSLESAYVWAEDMAEAKATVAHAVPVGMPFWAALDILKAAGARCVGDVHDRQIAKCAYRDTITVNDYNYAHVVWTTTVRLGEQDVAELSLTREIEN